MTIDDKIMDEKLQHDIQREAAKILGLSSGKFDKYEYLTGEEILLLDQGRVIEQAKFTYFPLGKALEKQRNMIEEQVKQQVEDLTVLKLNTLKFKIRCVIPENTLSEEAKNKLNKIKEIEKMIEKENLVQRTNEYQHIVLNIFKKCFKHFRYRHL